MPPIADSAAVLLDRLRKSGVIVTGNEDRLVLDGPNSTLTEELISQVRALKPALLAALAARPAPPRVRDGCDAHGIAADAVAARWAEVERRGLTPGFCACCSGPAPVQTLACRWCERLDEERAAELVQLRPCVLCGANGYTCDAELVWRCELCWKRGEAS